MKKLILTFLVLVGVVLIYFSYFSKSENINTKEIKTISENTKPKNQTPNIKSLTLKLTSQNLKEDENTTYKIIATYKNDTNVTILDKVKWNIKNKNIKIKDNKIIALYEGITQLQITYKNIQSNKVKLHVVKEINGYILPPKPDEDKNNETLLGIDVNNNGIRDDVERWIIQKYAKEEYPKTRTALALQYAWAEQKIIENPVVESKKYIDDVIDCQYFWIENKTTHMQGVDDINFLVKYRVFNNPKLNDKILNTKQRILQEFKFNEACSGKIFDSRKNTIDKCKTNILKLGE